MSDEPIAASSHAGDVGDADPTDVAHDDVRGDGAFDVACDAARAEGPIATRWTRAPFEVAAAYSEIRSGVRSVKDGRRLWSVH